MTSCRGSSHNGAHPLSEFGGLGVLTGQVG
jgi:hypothetical protein